MSTLGVDSVTKARQCWKAFGGHKCTKREFARVGAPPLKHPISHVCGVWLYDSEGWSHTVHVCRRCQAREDVK